MVHGRLKAIGMRFAVPFVVVLTSAGLALADAGGGASEADGSVEGAGSSNGRGDLATSVEHPASTGQEISELATTTDLEGWEKGAAISTLASGGMSQAGMHGPHATDTEPAEDHGGGPPSWAPASGHPSNGRGWLLAQASEKMPPTNPKIPPSITR